MAESKTEKAKKKQDDGRMENFSAIDRKTGAPGSHRATKELLQRPRAKGKKTRLEEFTRIDRGENV